MIRSSRIRRACMLTLITSTLVGIGCYILGIATSRKLTQVIKESSKQIECISTERSEFILILREIAEGLVESVSRMHQLHVSDIRDRKIEAEDHIHGVLEDQVGQVNNTVEAAKDAEQARHKLLNDDLDRRIEKTKEEYKKMDAMFRGDQTSDATRNLLSAAYALVASNRPTRGRLDTDLVQAVIRHRRDSDTTVRHEGNIPKGGELN